jgi:Sulfotransferase family
MYQTIRERPVFICGHPKSGTSLVKALLDSHPQLVVYPEETGFFRRYLPLAEGRPLEEKISLAETYLIHIFEWNLQRPPPHQRGFPDRDYSQISYEAVRVTFRQRLLAIPPHHDGDILSAAVLAFGQTTGQLSDRSSRWVEKSPYNERYTDRIFDWWPDARCIHIVRDPRDNFVSYRRKHPSWRGETFAESWTRSTQLGLQSQERLGDSRYLLLRYEDLVHTPEQTLCTIRAFLAIEQDPSLMTPTRAGVPWGGNSMFDQEFDAISAASADRWREELSPSDAGLIWLLARPEMQAMGYPPADDLPVASRFREAKWRFYRLRKRYLGRTAAHLPL